MSSILGKAWLPALAILAAFAMFAVGGTVQTASAEVIEDIDIVDLENPELYDYDGGGEDCEEASVEDLSDGDSIAAPVGGIIPLCIVLEADIDTVNAQADEGEFLNAVCGEEDGDDQSFEHQLAGNPANWQDLCDDQDGEHTSDITIYCQDGADSNCADGILLFYVCPDEAVMDDTITITYDNDVWELFISCYAEPDDVTVTARPTTVEIVPAIGSSAHSEITIVITGDGLPVWFDDTEIDVSVPKCAIEIGGDNPDSSPLADSTATDTGASWEVPGAGPNEDKLVVDNIWFHADWNNCTPGDVIVTVSVEVEGGADIVKTVTIKVVGPPAFITATAAPDKLICGEKSTITVKVTDAIGQNVSDNTRVELISNWGSVIAGTGATLGFPGTGPVNPLASSAAATYNGVAVAYLLTSNNHVGAYEVVAAAGGTVGFDVYSEPGGQFTSDPYWNDLGSNGLDRHDHERRGDHTNALLYSGAPITTQVTVTCSLPAAPVAPTVTAPSTGTGSITPPNTGDAGLASSSSNAMLFVIVGAAAFVLAGIASVSYARR